MGILLMQVEPAMMLIVLLMKLAIVPMEPVVQVIAPPMMKAAYAVGSLVARTEEEQLVIIAPYLCLFLFIKIKLWSGNFLGQQNTK